MINDSNFLLVLLFVEVRVNEEYHMCFRREKKILAAQARWMEARMEILQF